MISSGFNCLINYVLGNSVTEEDVFNYIFMETWKNSAQQNVIFIISNQLSIVALCLCRKDCMNGRFEKF